MPPSKTSVNKIRLIYFTDPVCSTCWLIEPHLYRLFQDYKEHITLDLKMGGLLPSWDKFQSPDNSQTKEEFLRNLINFQARKFGADMDGEIWAEEPIQSSFPASIAFHAAKKQDNNKSLKFLRTIREMLFIEKKDISSEHVLINAAIRNNLDLEAFIDDLKNGDAEKLFYQDLQEKINWKTTRFPTLIFINEKGDYVIDDKVLKTINESEILNYWQSIILKLSEGKIDRKIQNTDPIALMNAFDVLSTREMHIMSGTPIPHLKQRLDVYWNNGKIVKEEKENLDNWRVVEDSLFIKKNNFQFKSAAVIGGGIAGYTMAVCLKKNGIHPVIYERNNDNAAAGLGFLLLKNGIDALEAIGLKSKLLKKGNPINYFKAINPQGNAIYSQSLQDCIAISRASIMELLTDEFGKGNVLYNYAFREIGFQENGQIEAIQFHNGESIKSDIYFGSDGFRSGIRKQLFPHAELTSVGEQELVGTVHFPNLKNNRAEFVKIIDNVQGCSMGLIPLLNNNYLWFFQLNTNLLNPPDNNAESMRNFMLERVNKYPSDFKEIIQKTSFEHVFLWNSQRLDLLPKFHQNNLALIGDAAHPLLAFTSQGANSAIEDAVSLASLLSQQQKNESFEMIFEKYYDKRKEFIKKFIDDGDKLIEDFLNMNESLEYKIPLAIH